MYCAFRWVRNVFPPANAISQGVLFVKARAIANFGVCLRVRAFVGVWTTAFLSVVFTHSKRNIVVKVHWRFVIGVALRFTATTVLLVV